ncbi:MAG: pentapeptide repeat-containing protein [Spirirestis rafaelensis WJT71-NPBG6]|jgi:uncharacterized protein YjbI with pentapeptide repeats|nr:pentapeptide repeat-containing protein [Spirirestis rafaelensis WJT71-NPBG6]
MLLDYSGQNLRGRSFIGQNLEGANFSGADIRGADFSNAILKDADFKGAEAGVNQSLHFKLFMSNGLQSALVGFLPFFTSVSLVNIFKTTYFENTITVIVCLFVQAIFMIITVYKGLTVSFGTIVIVGALTGALSINATHSLDVAFSVTSAFVIPYAFGITLAVGVAYHFVFIYALFGIENSRNIKIMRFIRIMSLITAGGSAFSISKGSAFMAGSTSVFVLIIILLGEYIGRRSLAGDEKDEWLRSLAIASCAIKGTNFYGADLTNSDFTQALLQNTNFKNAILTRTRFHHARMLDCIRPGKSYLKKAYVRELLVTGEGHDKNFDRQDLRGINLQAANLVDTSFIGADLSEANLQDADLSRANLKQTQLDGTDFTGATLTGAYLEDWNITSNTKFDGVRCEYVYMRSPTKENPDPHRKPDNREEVFADGEFGDFIKPIFDTLDLYHNQGVDPRAIAISFKQLAENNPDAELEIVAMEKRGQDKFLLCAKTAATAGKSELSAEYFDTYNHLKALPEREIKLLIAEKDSRIRSLETMIVTALERPNFYAETYNNQGDTMPKKESNFNLQGAQFGGGLVDAETVNAHQIGGNITNNALEQPTETKNINAKTILILATNPKTTPRLRLDEEVREIDVGLQRAKKRELFDLKQRWAVRVQDIYQSLLDFKPQIVHFSGHGAGDDGLELEDETGKMRLVDTVALAELFKLFAGNIECVVLNACYSEVQAIAIAQHIPYVIGMNKAIGDKAAIKFAIGFYSALCAGESVEFAYKLGCNVIQLDGIPENLTPVLKKKL